MLFMRPFLGFGYSLRNEQFMLDSTIYELTLTREMVPENDVHAQSHLDNSRIEEKGESLRKESDNCGVRRTTLKIFM